MADPVPPAWMTAAARKWLEDAGSVGKDVGGAGAVDGPRAFNALPLSGVCVSLAEGGRALCSLRVPAHLTDAEGNCHAGAIAAAVDDVCAAAIMSVEGIIKVSVHYDISYFAPAKHHELNDHSQLRMYKELLGPAEKKYADSISEATMQKHAILSRALLRTTLLRYCKIDARSFENNKFGKPEILWPPDDIIMERPLHFNISHTTSLIACGIAMHAHIGIDIEETKRKTTKTILCLAHRFFTSSEANYLADISDLDAQQKEFFKLWTLKEAYVKALGLGISGAPFNGFSIMLETSTGIRISKA